MRRLASFLLLGVALAASATEVWRWKDANGVVHYSDSPIPGAERVNANPAPRPGGAGEAPSAPARPSVRQSDTDTPSQTGYTRCEVARPANDMTFNAADAVIASVAIEPVLQSGHRLQILLNGSVHPQWTGTTTTYTFAGLYRGAYTLAVRVLDVNGGTVCSGPAINFYIQQPTLLSPARQPPAAPVKPRPPPAGPAK